MTHANFVTNGSSLEDTHTNLIALGDLCGIRWRRLTLGDSYLTSTTTARELHDDPVLKSYSKCLAADLLCVWRRVVKNTTLNDGPTPGGRGETAPSFSKELWIFWYGNPNVSEHNECIAKELVEVEQGSWDNSGLSYECRTLLFKAFHNLIERCLLSRGFARFGRWFVQPLTSATGSDGRYASSSLASSLSQDATASSSRASTSENILDPDGLEPKTQLTIAFNFLVHGESTVCAAIDVRQHPSPIYRLNNNHLSTAAQAHGNGQQGIDVILSPYGIAGVLTGQMYKDTDPSVQRLLNEWKQFYPINQSSKDSAVGKRPSFSMSLDSSPMKASSPTKAQQESAAAASSSSTADEMIGQLPSVVEVLVAGTRMKYPTSYVFKTKSPESTILNNTVSKVSSSSNTTTDSFVRDCSSVLASSSSASANILTPPNSPPDFSADDSQGLRPPVVAPVQPVIPDDPFLIRDPVNQEIIVNRIDKQTNSSSSSTTTAADAISNVAKWDFSDPCQKSNCGCYRHKAAKKGTTPVKGMPGSTSNSSGNVKGKPEKMEKLPKVMKGTPFHKRNITVDILLSPTSPNTTPVSSQLDTTSTVPTSSSLSATVVSNSISQIPQPKTPSLAYKSPIASAGLASIASVATTPGTGLDSPRSAAPSIGGDGPPSTNPEMSLPSVSPHPPRSVAESHQDSHGPASAQKSHLEQLLSPFPHSNLKAQSSVESPLVNIRAQNGNSSLQTDTDSSSLLSKSQDGQGIKRPLLNSQREDDIQDRINRMPHLYDFSSYNTMIEGWDIPKPKRRREIYSKENILENHFLSTKPKGDPYEFREFEEDPFGVKTNNVEEQVTAAPYLNGTTEDNNQSVQSFTNQINGDIMAVTSPPKSRDLTRADELTPSFGDLDHLFESSGDESSDQLLTTNNKKENNNQSIVNGIGDKTNGRKTNGAGNTPPSTTNTNSATSIHCLPELHRMYPTPPSMEALAAPSPMEGGIFDERDIYPNSPLSLEHLKDASYVYKPPIQSKFHSSSKYAPLPDIPSIPNLPSECLYKMFAKNANQRAQTPSALSSSKPLNRPPGYSHHTPGTIPPHAFTQPRGMSPAGFMHGRMRGPNPMQPSFGAMSPMQTPNQFPFMSPHEQQRSLLNSNMYSPHQPSNVDLNASHSSPYAHFSAGHPVQSPRMTGPHLAGSSSMNMQQYDNSLMSRNRVQESAIEANALIINLALSDSLMNLFKDHNFESCTLCVCNMNLKGADVGVYLPDALVPGIYDESQYKCTCGFSAVVNRHRSALAGLFYEDEIEITGVVYDPVEGFSGPTESNAVVPLTDSKSLSPELVELIRIQCSTLLPSCSVFSKSLYLNVAEDRRCSSNVIALKDKSTNGPTNNAQNNQVILSGLKIVSKKLLSESSLALFRSDSCELTFFALKTGKGALDAYPSKLELQKWASMRALKGSCLHEWQFSETELPGNNLDTIRCLRALRPLLQASSEKKSLKPWEVKYEVTGPLTWRQFHRLAGRGTEDQCEPQPIPSLLLGHERDWVSVSPFALKFWEKMPLEPFSVQRDVAYLVIAPNNQNYLSAHLKTFFKELSTTYELMRLGKHAPIVQVLREGILKVPPGNKNDIANEEVDEWFNRIGDSEIAGKLKLYAQVCKAYMVALVSQLKLDKSIFDSQKTSTPNKPETQTQSSASGGGYQNKPSSSVSADHHSSDSRNTDDNGNESGPSHGLPSFSTMAQQENEEEDPTRQPAIVIYMIEPFTMANLDKETYRLACLGMLRCYSMVFSGLPENIKKCINLQIISLDSILESATDFRGCTRHEQLKSLALSVYSQSRKSPISPHISKSLTGFGPAASLDEFLKQHHSFPSILYMPPYILAPLKDKQTELGHMFGDQREKSQNMFVSYCLTEDQRWMVVACSNERGDLLETTLINVEIPNRPQRKKAPSVRRFGLQKLMEFILQVMSEASQSWRLIVGRLGRVGHGELREWSSLLSKKALLRYSKNVREQCGQCKNHPPHDAPLILSACLISLECDTALRVFSDQYTPDDRFSSSCNTCSLSTPEDASCTHILTFPTSTTMQSSQGNFQMDPIGMGSMGDDDLMNAFGGADTDDLGVDDGLGGLFDWGDPDDMGGGAASPLGGDHGLGGTHGLDNASHIGFDNNVPRGPGGVLGDGPDEPCQLLQQPLAMGYYVSTAPTGMLPKWFWQSAPHLKDSLPSFLKSALLIHIPSVHNANDDLLQSNANKNYHPLDSNLTTDVLRYVLEGYNSLSWLSIDPARHDRTSCLPIHIQMLLQLCHTVQALT